MRKIILDKLQQLEFDWISMAKGYLSGLLGALTVFAVMHYYDAKPNMVGTVNITYLVEQYSKQEAAKNLPIELLKKEVSEFGSLLEHETKKLSLEKHLVLLPNQAVIAGSKDYTAIVRARMDKQMSHEDIPNVD